MIPYFIEEFQNNKEKLQSALKAHIEAKGVDFDTIDYKNLLELVIKNCFKDICYHDIKEIDFGEYQGTLIFVFHRDVYQPAAYETYYTSLFYGSCSCCDTLLGIIDNVKYDDYDNPIIDEKLISDLMLICLHMVENINSFERTKI